mgnify:CR=1 FL=1
MSVNYQFQPFMKKKPILETLFILKIVLFLISAIAAGYTVMDVKPSVLEVMTKPIPQLILNFVMTASFLSFTFKEPQKDTIKIVSISIGFSILLYIFRMLFVSDKPFVTPHEHVDEDGDGVTDKIIYN